MADEVALLRVGIRRLFAMTQVSTTPAEWAMILDAIGTASVRIAGLLRAQRMIEGGQSNLSEALSQALTEVCNELPSKNQEVKQLTPCPPPLWALLCAGSVH